MRKELKTAQLIGIAIDLLKESDIDWGKVQNIQDLKKVLDI